MTTVINMSERRWKRDVDAYRQAAEESGDHHIVDLLDYGVAAVQEDSQPRPWRLDWRMGLIGFLLGGLCGAAVMGHMGPRVYRTPRAQMARVMRRKD